MRLLEGLVIVVAVLGFNSCNGSSAVPSSPSTSSVAPSPPTGLVLFRDRTSGFSTSDLRDAQDQIFQLSAAGEFIQAGENLRVPGYRISGGVAGGEDSIEGTICVPSCAFVVRFGIKDGERRAYLTVDYGHDNPGTIVDVEVSGNALVVKQTALYPPGSPTLSGVVREATPDGPRPVEGVKVNRGVITGWRQGTTDSNGFYEIRGLLYGVDSIETRKEGFADSTSQLAMSGDTRFDISIVRR